MGVWQHKQERWWVAWEAWNTYMFSSCSTPPKRCPRIVYNGQDVFKTIILTSFWPFISTCWISQRQHSYTFTVGIKIILPWGKADGSLELATPGQLLRWSPCLEHIRWGSGSTGNFIHWLHCLPQWNILWLWPSCISHRKIILLAFNNFPDRGGQKDPVTIESSHMCGD